MSSISDPIIKQLRKSIPETEARIRQMKKDMVPNFIKPYHDRICELMQDNLEADVRFLKKLEGFKNEEIKQKFNKKTMNNLIGVSGGIKCGKDLVGQMIQYIGDEVGEPTFEGFQEFQVTLYTKYQIKKCADKLKDCLCLILGCTREQLEDRDYKNTELSEDWWYYLSPANVMIPYKEEYIIDGVNCPLPECDLVKLTPRMMLQLLGTEGGRMVIHPNIWVNALFADYYDGETLARASGFSQKTDPSNWVITDVRFPENEGKAVSDRGGLLIGIRRKFGLRFPEYEFRELPYDPYGIPSMLQNDDELLFDMLMHESEIKMGDHSWCDVVIENNGTVEDLFNEVLKAVYYKKELV